MPYSYNYYQKIPTKSVQFSNFTGAIDFEFSTNQLEYCDLLEFYGQIRPRIEQNITNVDGTNITSLLPVSNPPRSTVTGTPVTGHDLIPYLAKNYINGMFTNANMYLNDKMASTVTDIPVSDTLIRSAFESKSIMESIDSTNPINPMSIEDTVVPVLDVANNEYQTYGFSNKAAVSNDTLQNFTKICPYTGRNLYAWNNMGAFKYNIENECTFTLPLPLFSFAGLNPQGIPPGNKVKIQLFVNPYYHTNMIQFNQALPALVGGYGIANVVQLSGENTCPANSIGVGIQDFFLQVRIVNKPNPLDEVILLKLRQVQTQIHTISSQSEQFPLSVPVRNMKYILACFVNSKRYGQGISPSDFSDVNVSVAGRSVGAVTSYNFVRFQYHGISYPEFIENASAPPSDLNNNASIPIEKCFLCLNVRKCPHRYFNLLFCNACSNKLFKN